MAHNGYRRRVLVPSHSVTAVLAIGPVNSGVMQLHRAIGFIVGACIRTTIPSWILALGIGKCGLPLLGVSVFGSMFSTRKTVRYPAMALGLIFVGLELMNDGLRAHTIGAHV